ncbi:MAG: HD domain-containing protein [Roseburia sp.]
MERLDRTKAKQEFAAYTDRYDSADPKIKLKITHTYRVAGLCEKIGASIGLGGVELDVAWMCGLLHDIGRFEQIRRYGTFSDAESVDHAQLSAEILFGAQESSGEIRRFVADDRWDSYLQTAIRYHSAYRIPGNLDEKTVMYCNILRDADKIDILRVNLDTPMEEIYNVTTEELRNSQVTPEVMQAFDEHHAVLRALKKTAVDYPVGHISLTYELVYPMSRRLMKEQGYLDRLMNFESDNPVTRQQFAHIREEMGRFLQEE